MTSTPTSPSRSSSSAAPRKPSSSVEVHTWLVDGLHGDVRDSIERLARSEDVRHVAVMPDVHLANDVCVGVALATTRTIYPAAVGSDIGCGMSAVAFDAEAALLDDPRHAAEVLHLVGRAVPVNRHGGHRVPEALPTVCDPEALSHPRLATLARRDGRVQLGTLGRGNHFVEFQSDETNRLWLMVHTGSRGIGQAISAHHAATADRTATGLLALDARDERGRGYLNDVGWAIRYARENRRAIVAAIRERLAAEFHVAADEGTWIDCHHDHVRREAHGGCRLWVHRKGALSAAAGEPGIIPGSMGTASFHVEGRGCEAALESSSHGAGRRLHRTEARRAIGARQLEREMSGVWFDHRLRHRLRDEAPSAYKDVHAVLRAQRPLTRIVRELRPRLVYKGA